MSGVLGISVTEVVLQGAQVGALVGKVLATRVAQHVRPDAGPSFAVSPAIRTT
jgi:hypothetical protein